MLHAFAERVGGRKVRLLPPGSDLPADAGTFARRSEVYGRFPPVRVDDRGARALGFAPAGVDEGLDRTVAWLTTLSPPPDTTIPAAPGGPPASELPELRA